MTSLPSVKPQNEHTPSFAQDDDIPDVDQPTLPEDPVSPANREPPVHLLSSDVDAQRAPIPAGYEAYLLRQIYEYHTYRPLTPGTPGFEWLKSTVLNAAAHAAVYPPLPPGDLAIPSARMRHLLGVAMATKGLELISGEINGEVANWMMQPAFFPALWVLSCGNPELSAEMQLETNGYTAWYLSAMANGLMPVPGAMPVLVRSEERQGSSTWGGTEGEADTQA